MNTGWKTILPVLFVCAGCAGSSTPAAQDDAGLTKDEALIDMGQKDRDEAGAEDIVELEPDVSLRDMDVHDYRETDISSSDRDRIEIKDEATAEDIVELEEDVSLRDMDVLDHGETDIFSNDRDRVEARDEATAEDVSGSGEDSLTGDPDTSTVKPLPPYENVTWQLGEMNSAETRGAVLFRQTIGRKDPTTGQIVETSADFLFRTYGTSSGSKIMGSPPTLQVAVPGGGVFKNWSAKLPQGLDDFLPGRIAAGDLNHDGCKDIVIPGFLEQDPSPAQGQILPFRGTPTRVLIQDVIPSGTHPCAGTFHILNAPPLTTDRLINRKVVLADINGDGNLDVLMPGVHYPTLPGGEHGIRLYLGDGNGNFTDASELVPDDPEMDGYAIAACDIDGDGDLDIIESGRRRLYVSPATRKPHVVMNMMTKGHPETLSFSVSDPSTTGFTGMFRAVDISCAYLDPDSRVDLVVFALQQNSHNKLFKNLTQQGGPVKFSDVSGRLPDLTSGLDGFDYIHEQEWTQSTPFCRLEDDPTKLTLFYGNGDINNRKFQSNAVMRFGPDNKAYSVHKQLGFGFDKAMDLTAGIVCADLDGNGAADAVFVANHGRSYLYRYRGSTGSER